MSVSEEAPARGGRREGAGANPGTATDVASGRRRQIVVDLERWAKDYDAYEKQNLRTGITSDALRLKAIRGLSAIEAHMDQGNLQAAIYLVDRLLGRADRSYSEVVAGAVGAELRIEILQALASVDLPPAVAQLVAERLAGPVEESAAEVVTQALPPPG